MRTRAFTIVELLVVLGIAALLIGLLIPALASVSSSARSTRCQLNLKQMATAAQNYAAIYDAFPAAIHYERVNTVFRTVSWDWVMTGSTVISPGTLWSFTDNPGEVMQCPDYSGSSNFGEEFTGYNYNTGYIGGEAQFPLIGWKYVRPGVAPHACNRASRCAMFGDAGRKDQSNKYMRGPLPRAGMPLSDSTQLNIAYNGAQAFRHAHATNIGFVDGHVGSRDQPCKGNVATTSLLTQMRFPDNGFLSDDDSAYDPR